MTELEAIRARYEKWMEQVCFDVDGLGCGECNAGQAGYSSAADIAYLISEVERLKEDAGSWRRVAEQLEREKVGLKALHLEHCGKEHCHEP